MRDDHQAFCLLVVDFGKCIRNGFECVIRILESKGSVAKIMPRRWMDGWTSCSCMGGIVLIFVFYFL